MMSHILTDGRLTLRPLAAEDGADIVTYLNDAEVNRWLTRVPVPYSAEDAAEFIGRKSGPRAGMVWAITTGGPLLGVVGLESELGYWLGRPHWGQGITTAAAALACAHWFADPARPALTSGHFDGNTRSRSLLLRAGFRDVGPHEFNSLSLGRRVPGRRMQLTRDAWRGALAHAE